MKTISFAVCGDARIDGDFGKDAFLKVIETVKKYSLNYLFLPGDFFEKRSPDFDTVNFAKDCFSQIKKTNVIIVPGNHDPFTVGSVYYSEAFPENVKIFKYGEISFFEFLSGKTNTNNDDDFLVGAEYEVLKRGVRIYGGAFEGHFQRTSLTENLQLRLSSDFINVFMMHGSVNQEAGGHNYIDVNELKKFGFDMIVLGGPHEGFKKDNVICSGILESKGFDESGDRGIIVGEINSKGRVVTEFLPMNENKYITVNFDMSVFGNVDEDSIVNAILLNKCDHIRVILKGILPADVFIGTDYIKNKLLKNYKSVEIVDDISYTDNVAMVSRESTLRGLFVRKLLEKQNNDGEGTDKPKFSASCYNKALNIGLKTLRDIENTKESN